MRTYGTSVSSEIRNCHFNCFNPTLHLHLDHLIVSHNSARGRGKDYVKSAQDNLLSQIQIIGSIPYDFPPEHLRSIRPHKHHQNRRIRRRRSQRLRIRRSYTHRHRHRKQHHRHTRRRQTLRLTALNTHHQHRHNQRRPTHKPHHKPRQPIHQRRNRLRRQPIQILIRTVRNLRFGVCETSREDAFEEVAQGVVEQWELREGGAVAGVEGVAAEVGDVGEGLTEVGESFGCEGYVFHLAEVFEVADCGGYGGFESGLRLEMGLMIVLDGWLACVHEGRMLITTSHHLLTHPFSSKSIYTPPHFQTSNQKPNLPPLFPSSTNPTPYTPYTKPKTKKKKLTILPQRPPQPAHRLLPRLHPLPNLPLNPRQFILQLHEIQSLQQPKFDEVCVFVL